MTPSDPAALLLAQRAAWLHGLAADLLADPHAAEDVAQDVALLALERGRHEPGWLAAVARRRATHRAREEGRRRWRERVASRPEGAPSSELLLSRHETRERVARAVGELDEPYREALLRRYFEGQSPREIALATGANPSTVRGRLAEGLERLRVKLRREWGDLRWGVALLPLVERSRILPWVLTGAGITAAALVALFAFGEPPARGLALQEPESSQRGSAVRVAGTLLEGRLVDGAGRAIEGARVRVVAGEDPGAAALTDDQGRFALGLTLDPMARADGSAYVTLRASAPGFQPAERAYHFPPAARKRDGMGEWGLVQGGTLRGKVVDGAGRPAADVHLWLNGEDLDRRVHADGRGLAQETLTEADGSFELPIPIGGRWFLRSAASPIGRVWRDGIDLEVEQDHDLGVLQLEQLGVIEGRFVDDQNAPFRGADVQASLRDGPAKPWTTSTGDRTARASSDEHGNFRIAGLERGEYELRGVVMLAEGGLWEWSETVRTGRKPLVIAVQGRSFGTRAEAADRQLESAGQARLRVRALDPTGQPYERFEVRYRLQPDDHILSYWSDSASGGLSGPLPAGRVELVVHVQSGESEREQLARLMAGLHGPASMRAPMRIVELQEGGVTGVDITLLPAGHLRLVTRRADGAPDPARLEVVLDGDLGHPRTLLDGRFPYLASVGDIGILGPLSPGEHELVIRAWGFGDQTHLVRVVADQVTTLEVELEGH